MTTRVSTEQVQCDYCLDMFPLEHVKLTAAGATCMSCGAHNDEAVLLTAPEEEVTAPLTPEEKQVLSETELAERELCRRHLIPFICRFKPDYKVGWVHKVFAAKLEQFFQDVVDQKDPRLIIQVPPRGGKALANDTPVLTRNKGWVTHGALEVGDEVFHPSGAPTRVIAVSEETTLEHRVTFSNGDEITAHAEHEWAVYDRRSGKRPLRVVETRDIVQDVWIGRQGIRGSRARWQLPETTGVEFEQQDLPMDPYVLGVWLGDGTVGTNNITNSKEDAAVLQRAFAEAGYECSGVYVHTTYGTHRSYFGNSGLTPSLHAAGVFHDKHIPDKYLLSSREQRKQLLAGLIDTDGHVDTKTGRVIFTTVSGALRDGVVDLATTLGYRPYVMEAPPQLSSSGIQGRHPVFSIGFQPFETLPTRLERKQIRKHAMRRRVSVAGVKKVGGRHGRCIQVSAPDGLYLAGRSLIPTHNSEIVSNNFPSWVLGKKPDFEIIMTAHTLSLPLEFSKANRDRMNEERYKVVFPDVKLDQKTTSAERWRTAQRGGVKCAGVGGGIGGFGAHILIIDDPIKDFEDAQSETIRTTVKNWYSSTAEARLSPGGGVIIVMCMTGDTPVLMADGVEKKLDEIRPGDDVASYDRGELVSAKVLNWKSQGYDSVYRITTSSGRIVTANKRHPFLVSRNGELGWVRLENLKLGTELVGLHAEPTPAKNAKKRVAESPQRAEVFVCPTTTNGSGLAGIDPHQPRKILLRESALSLNTATESRSTITKVSWIHKAGGALFAGWSRMRRVIRSTGTIFSASTIATTRARSGACCATTATSLSGEALPLSDSKPQPSIFGLEEITSIEYVGEKEVFDVQIEGTENFIANGLVSHNTRWHDGDLAGEQLRLMKELREEGVPEEEISQWEVVSFPAISESDEYLTKDLRLVDAPEPGAVLVRRKDQALHPARYNIRRLKRKRATTPPQIWSALYQQKPVPDSGEFFKKDDFMYYAEPPQLHHYPVLFAWDLAVGEKQRNDYTVGLAGVVIPVGGLNQIYLLDHYKNRVRDREQLEAIVNMYLKYRANAGSLGLEYGQIFLSIEMRLLAEFKKHGITPSLDRELVPVRDKRVRATPAQGWMQHHRIWFPKHQAWAESMKDELLRFDAGVHDDQVDALAWMVRMAQKMPLVKNIHEIRRNREKTVEEQLRDLYRGQQMGETGATGYMTA